MKIIENNNDIEKHLVGGYIRFKPLTPMRYTTPKLPAEESEPATKTRSASRTPTLPRYSTPRIPTTKAAAKEAKTDPVLSSTMISQLITNGLTPDVNLYIDAISKINPDLMKNPLMAYLIMIDNVKNINRIVNNKKDLDSAIKTAQTNGGLDEVAVNELGQMWCMDIENSKIEFMSPKNFHDKMQEAEDSGSEFKIRPLTNRELAYQRANDPQFAFNSNIATTIRNSMGMEKIYSFVTGIIDKIQKDSITQDAYSNSPEQYKLRGIDQLIEKGGSGLYKTTSKTQGVDEDKRKYAINSIMTLMPTSMKEQLQARAVLMGLDPIEGCGVILAQLIHEQTGTTSSIEIEKIEDKEAKTAKGKTSTSTGATGAVEMDPASVIYNEIGGMKAPYRINPGGNSEDSPNTRTVDIVDPAAIVFDAPTWKNGSETTKLNNAATLQFILQDSSISKIKGKGSVYFGDKKLESGEWKNIVYDPADGMAIVMLPTDSEGNPDFKKLRKMQDLYRQENEMVAEAETRGTDLPYQDIADIWEKAGEDFKQYRDYIYNIEKHPEQESRSTVPGFDRFIAFTGLTSTKGSMGDEGRLIGDHTKVYDEKDVANRDLKATTFEEGWNWNPNPAYITDETTNRWSPLIPNADIIQSTIFVPISKDPITTEAVSGGIYSNKAERNWDVLSRNTYQVQQGNTIETNFATDLKP